MNVKRGFFRLWIGVSLCWIIGLGWYLRNDLHFDGPWTLSSPPLDCPKELPTENTRPLTKLTDKELECAIAVMEAQSWEERARLDPGAEPRRTEDPGRDPTQEAVPEDTRRQGVARQSRLHRTRLLGRRLT